MLYIILIILLIIVWNQNSNLKQENFQLRTLVYRWQEYYNNMMNKSDGSFTPVKQEENIDYSNQYNYYQQNQSTGYNNQQYNNYQGSYYENYNQNYYQAEQANNNIIKNKPVKAKEVVSDTEKKNIAVLITGALFIILAAIVFLTSTWDTIPNVLKTIVLVLLTMVFLGGSYIAKEKFKLEKTSQTFFYIAMVYIPICLFSISAFSLLGDYLSIIGEGKYIYLTIASLFISGIYYYIYVIKNNIYLLHGSIVSQMLFVVLFSLIFADSVVLIGINLLLYNILLAMLTKSDLFNKIYNTIPLVISMSSIFGLAEKKYLMVGLLVLLIINFLILEMKKHSKITSYMLNGSIMALGVYYTMMHNEGLNISICIMALLGYILSVYSIEILLINGERKIDMQNSLDVLAVVIIAFLHLFSFGRNVDFPSYIISIVQIVIVSCIYFENSDTKKKICSVLLPLYFISTGLNFIESIDVNYDINLIFAFLTFGISEVFRKKAKTLHKASFIISNVFVLLTAVYVLPFYRILIFEYKPLVVDLFYLGLLLALYVYCYIVEKKSIFKYAMYIVSNLFLLATVKLLFDDYSLIFNSKSLFLFIVPMIMTIVVMIVELLYPKLKDSGSDAYIMISQFLSFLFLYGLDINIAIVAVVVSSTSIIIISEKYKDKNKQIFDVSLIISHFFLALTYVRMFNMQYDLFITNVLYSSILLTIYVYCFFIDKKSVFKYAIYLASNYWLLTIVRLIFGETDFVFVIPLITTLAVMSIEFVYPKLRDKISDIYVGISQFIFFTCLYMLSENIAIALVLNSALLLVIYNFKYKNVLWNILPLICAIPALFMNNLDSGAAITLMIIVTLIVTMGSVLMKKISIFTLFSGLYLVFTLGKIDSAYATELFIAGWAVVHALSVDKEKYKDMFKLVLYIALLAFYNTGVGDLGFNDVTAVAMFGYIVTVVVTLQTVLKKYVPDIEILEYIAFILMYLFAFGNYLNELDGMIFGCLMVAIIVFSYLFKRSAIFIVTIIGLIINVLLLTREFWFSVPWWIYLLLVGTLLIAFAVRNEMGDKKEKITINKLIVDLKNKLDGNQEENKK